jgi:hypothetical protein
MARKKLQEKVQEPPVVFFLKISEESNITPLGETTSYSALDAYDHPTYSQILEVHEVSETTRFTTEILKPILESLKKDSYSADTACFWCCHQFKGYQFSLPLYYDTYKNIYTCKGNFCSPECSLAYLYADNTISDGTRWNKHVLLNALYSSLYTEPISPAPSRSLLRMFGGPLDIKQYRSYLLTNDLVHENFAPIRLLFPVMAIQGPLRDIKKIVSLSNDVVEKASESLRLKRSKPVNLNVPTLDLCIKSS